ncbi:unnamed protein product [Closterium sp. Naga37s-1]|nr:unnamed protein product [Closterium sp. Naga37s-1]
MTRVVPAQCADSVLKMKRFWEEQGEWPESLHVEIPDPGSQKEWSGQVFRLRNVFVNWRGQVFNQTHLFDTGRCGDRLADFDYPLGTRFATFPALLNLLSTALSPSDVVFSEMAEKLPLFLSLAPAMSLLRRIPVAVQNRKLVRGIWQAVVGLRPTASAIHAMAHSSLLFARTLYMPLFPPCGHPSPSLLHAFRARHLFPASGLPLFSPTAAYLSPEQGEQGEAEGAVGMPMGPMGPMGSMDGRLKHDWVVVVAAPPSRLPTVQAAELAAALRAVKWILKQLYTEDRVAVYRRSMPLLEARELFQRALLFVACGNALVNTLFMPSHSSVIEIRTSTSSSSGGADSVSGEGFRTKIPGSKVSRAGLKEKFLKWQECVAAEGSWKFDPRPRRLPWEFKGYSNYCDKRHMAASPTAVVVSKADQIADSIMKLPPEERKVRQEEWDVRPQLKYVWDTEGKCGAWEAFDGRVVCDWMRGRRWNGTGMPLTEEEEEEREEAAFKGEAVREKGDGSGALVLLIGDSLQEQFVRVLVNNMLTHVKKPATWAAEETIPKECSELIEPDHARHSFCRDYKLHSNVCANLTIRFIRHDYLQLSNSQIKFDRVPFARLSILAGARVFILNRGAHYRPDRHFISAVRSTLRFLRNKLPDALLIYRTTVHGHANCSEHDKPLLVPGPTDNLPFFWGKFHEQNELARAAVEEVGGVYLDVAAMTVLRPDSHQGFIPELNHEDCLHYCIPGPQDVWAQMLQNVLLQLLPEPAPAAAAAA